MKVTILGAGAIAGAHAEAIRALADHGGPGGVVLTHVVDLDADRAAAFAAEHGVPHHGTDLQALLDAGEVDAVHICTPPSVHLPAALAALRAGAHVVVEKPAVLSLAEVDALAAAERQAVDAGLPGRFTQVVQHRFGAGVLRLRRLLDDGTLGPAYVAQCETSWFRPPAYFEVPWRGRFDTEGGGTTMGHGIHQFDLLVAVLGPWAEVRAMAGRLARHTDTEDVSTALVRFANGTLATITNSAISPRQTSRLRFDTEAATVELEHLYGYSDADWTVTPAEGREDVAERWAADVAGTDGTGESGHLAQLVPTYRALVEGRTPPVTVADTRSTLELAAAIYKSAFTGLPVRAGEITADDPFHGSMAGTGTPWPPVKDA